MKLGKLAPKLNPRTLMFSRYADSSVPIPPKKVWREFKVHKWGMLGNDVAGDCTCAAIAHMLMLVSAHTGKMVTPTLDDVFGAYSAISGYDRKTGANDNGAAITDVLDYWRTTGIAGHKILGWAKIAHSDIQAVKQAIWLFGGVNLGVQLPQSAEKQFAAGKPWEMIYENGDILGGHSIPNFGYGSDGTNCITWGKRQEMSWEWFAKYADEAYCVITSDWIDKATKKTPSGFDLATLQKDLKALAL
jgi:hypothetical protein